MGGQPASSWALIGTGDCKPLHFPLQSGTLHAKSRSGTVRPGYYPAGLAKNVENVIPLDIDQSDRQTQGIPGIRGRFSRLLHNAIRPASAHLTGRHLQITRGNLKRGAGRKNDGTLYYILHFANVARPLVTNQSMHYVKRNGLDLPAHAPCELLSEMASKQRNVFGPLAQRR